MPGYALCGSFTATPGNAGALTDHLLAAAAALEDVPGCLLYLVGPDPQDDDAVRVLELWDSAEAHRASLELDAVRTLITHARPLIAGMGERTELHPVGGKGLPTTTA